MNSSDEKPTAISSFLRIAFVVVFRTLLIGACFFAGHLAFSVHWGLALLLIPVAIVALIKFWSPIHALD